MKVQEGSLSSGDDPVPSSPPRQTRLQQQSAFFSILPLEIRQNIYQYLWIAAGSTQHVYKSSHSALEPLSHCACISDPDAEDDREIELTRVLASPPADQTLVNGVISEEAAAQRDEINDWRLRNASQWCNHWRCEEEPPALRPVDGRICDEDEPGRRPKALVKEFSPFLAILLSCKRMYQEAVNSIYDDTTFSFVGTESLSRFLTTTAAESLVRIKTLHLVWAAPVESYMDANEEEAVAARFRWGRLWKDVALKLPHLKELRMWQYPQYARYPMPHEEWFKPLHQFRHVPKFDISLRWFLDPPRPETGPLDFLDAGPFEYDRIPPLQENPLHFHWRRLIGLFFDEPTSARRQRKRRYIGRA